MFPSHDQEGAAADLVMKTIEPGLNKYVQKKGELPTDRKDLGLSAKDIRRLDSVVKLLGEKGYKGLSEGSNLTKFLTEIVPSRIQIGGETREDFIAGKTEKTKEETVETSKAALQEIFNSIEEQVKSLQIQKVDEKVQDFSPEKAFEIFAADGVDFGEVDKYFL